MKNKYIIDKFTNIDSNYRDRVYKLSSGFFSTNDTTFISDILYVYNYNNQDYINKYGKMDALTYLRIINTREFGFLIDKY